MLIKKSIQRGKNGDGEDDSVEGQSGSESSLYLQSLRSKPIHVVQ